MTINKSKRVAFFIGTLAGGGAERVVINLTGEFVRYGIETDLLVTKFKGPLATSVPDGVNVIELEKSGKLKVLKYILKLPISNWFIASKWLLSGEAKVISRLPALLNYVNNTRPHAILSTLDAVNIVSLWTKYISNQDTIYIVRQAIFQSQELMYSHGFFETKLLPVLAKRWYSTADKIVCVSKEMAKDLKSYCDVHQNKLITIYNPVHIGKIIRLSGEKINHPWLINKTVPVILAVGRMVKQKNYPVLFRAVKKIRGYHKVKLIVLGQGPEQKKLEQLSKDLELDDSIDMLGHVSNPYQYMARADLFVLSSSWEGLPNVILEALACGCKVVSTNCRSGPKEILDHGKYGTLVSVDDVDALSQGIVDSLKVDIDKKILRDRAAEFDLSIASSQYLKCIMGD